MVADLSPRPEHRDQAQLCESGTVIIVAAITVNRPVADDLAWLQALTGRVRVDPGSSNSQPASWWLSASEPTVTPGTRAAQQTTH